MEARILKWTSRKPTDGSTHWTTRKLGKKLGISHTLVATVWKRANPKIHRIERYMASNDPDFETKAADVIGLYVDPPQHAAVFCVDEKTAIQALDRLDPVLPFSPGRLERHGFEYYRHGTLSLYAALDTKSGEVIGKTAVRHTSEEFVAFFRSIVASQPKGKEIHIILDNLSAHKTERVKQFLVECSRASAPASCASPSTAAARTAWPRTACSPGSTSPRRRGRRRGTRSRSCATRTAYATASPVRRCGIRNERL